jgi:formylglycine-generating enzyme required for sulfatase activity
MPITCVPHATARAFCRFEGGDLPTEAQWEYLALMQGRAEKTAFPWGDDAPSCDDAVFGRSLVGAATATPCGGASMSLGPLPVDRGGRDDTPSGVHGLGASVCEPVRDGFVSYAAACWAGAPLYDPACEVGVANLIVVRGSSWGVDVPLTSASRTVIADAGYGNDAGIRCVRRR